MSGPTDGTQNELPPGGPAPGGPAPGGPAPGGPAPGGPAPGGPAPSGQAPGGLPPGGPAPGLQYGSAGIRLVAYIIDGLILGAISGALSGMLGLGWFRTFGLDVLGRDGPGFGFGDMGAIGAMGALWIGFIGWIAVTTIVSGVYFVGLWTRNGATVGQAILSLEVRNAADGARIGQDQAIRRWAYLVVPVVSALPALGIFVLIYQIYLLVTTSNDPAKQGFHDKQVGTVVVRAI
jgi:uncharacterized RDD family membrane protein YckC